VRFFVSLVADGILAGTIYALIALAFVVVYKASGMANFALGEWALLGTRLVAAGSSALGLALPAAVGSASAATGAAAVAFNRLVVLPLAQRPLISVIMVTLGLGAAVRGAVPLLFRAVPAAIPLAPLPPVVAGGLAVPGEKLIAAAVAVVAVGALGWFFHRTRTGLALQAIADDPRAAMATGIDIQRHFSITWALMGVVSVTAGTLWMLAFGGGFGIELFGLKVFPILVLGGLDSIAGSIVGAMAIGLLEALTAGYLDPIVGGGFSRIACYLVLVATLIVRPYGMFGRPDIRRI